MRISDWSSDVCSSDLGKRSACAAASAQCRTRSTNDLYLFNREHFARLRRRIANPVDKSAPFTVEAANEGPVAQGIAAFRRAKRNSGHRAKRLNQLRRTYVIDPFISNDRYRSRCLKKIGRATCRQKVRPDV